MSSPFIYIIHILGSSLRSGPTWSPFYYGTHIDCDTNVNTGAPRNISQQDTSASIGAQGFFREENWFSAPDCSGYWCAKSFLCDFLRDTGALATNKLFHESRPSRWCRRSHMAYLRYGSLEQLRLSGFFLVLGRRKKMPLGLFRCGITKLLKKKMQIGQVESCGEDQCWGDTLVAL